MSSVVQAVLLAAFLVTLVYFGRTVGHLFDTHGAALSPWFRRGSLGLLGVFCLWVLFRLLVKVASIRGIRREMADLKAMFRERTD